MLAGGDAAHLSSLAEIGMLGSMIDTHDSVPEAVCDELSAGGDQDIRFLAKLQSPERGFRDDPSWCRTDRDFFFTEAPCPIRNPPDVCYSCGPT